MEKIAITLRGHVRTSFDDKKLYNFLKQLTSTHDVDIYVYTFNIKSTGKIYKSGDNNLDIDYQKISENDVKDYLDDLTKYTKKIIVDDNNSAKTTNEYMVGTVSRNKFLHMWTSIYNIIKYVKMTNINYSYVINMRLDYFQLSDKFPQSYCSSEIEKIILY